MKKVISLLLSVLMVLSIFTIVPFEAFAGEAKQSTGASSGITQDCTWELDNNGVLTISGKGDMQDYSAGSAPWGQNITAVNIEKGVMSIAYYAFYGCTNITNVAIPDSVSEIGWYAFQGCTGLKSVVIPNSVSEIGQYSFDGCTNLTIYGVAGSAAETYARETGFDFVEYTPEVDWSWSFNNGVLTISGSGPMANYDSMYNTPWQHLDVKKIIISDGITEIGRNAFYNLPNLESVIIGDTVTCIGDYAFYRCGSLKSITIPDSVTYLGTVAFTDCTELESVTLGKSVGEVACPSLGYTFNGCAKLKSITVDKDNNYFDSRNDCNAIIEKTTNTLVLGGNNTVIPDTVTKIGDYAFAGRTEFKRIDIPNTVTGIGSYSFYKCNGIKNIIIPDSVTEIGASAFYQCENMTSVSISSSVTTINDSAFAYCVSLISIDIPDSVSEIGMRAFYSCTSLKIMVIPKTVKNIWSKSLGYVGNNKVSGFTICGYKGSEAETYAKSNGFAFLEYELLGNGRVSIVKYTGSDSEFEIPSEIGCNIVTRIDESAFYNCSDLFSIIIPDSVTTIGDSAFEECDSLETVKIGSSVTSIGNSAFKKCAALTSVAIPDSIKNIGNSAFSGCTGLTEIIGGKSVESFGTDVFYNCPAAIGLTGACFWYRDGDGLLTISGNGNMEGYGQLYNDKIPPWGKQITSVVIENGVKDIACDAFRDCKELKSVVIPDSVTGIGYSSFQGCTGLTSITIPESVNGMGDQAFADCTNLESAVINSSAIYWYMFSGCTALKSVTISDNVQFIEGEAFKNCTGLTSIVIPESVTSIANSAFYGNTNLTIYGVQGSAAETFAINNDVPFLRIKPLNDETAEITKYFGSGKELNIPSEICGYSVTSIGNNAFEDCSSLTSVTIPDSVKSIGDYAFMNCGGLTNIDVPDSVESIGRWAFAACANLKEITLSNSLTSIDYNILECCSSLESINIPEGVTWIKSQICIFCTNLKSVTIPNGVTHIQSEAFYHCTNLKSVLIPDSVTTIDDYAFGYYCQNYNETVKMEDFTIFGVKGSAAETYAVDNGFKFEEVFYCSTCNKYLTKDMIVIDEAKPATYTETGLTEGSHCSVCGEALKAQEIIPTLEPTTAPPTETTEPTTDPPIETTEPTTVPMTEPTEPVTETTVQTTEVTEPVIETTEPTTVPPIETTEPTTVPMPETTEPVTYTTAPTTVVTEPATIVPVETRAFNFLPNTELAKSADNFKLVIQDTKNILHTYDFIATGIKIDGVKIYTANVPVDFDIAQVQYQMYKGETWLGQMVKSASEISEIGENVVKADGTVLNSNEPTTEPSTPTPTETDATEPTSTEPTETQTITDKPTEPVTTEPVSTEPAESQPEKKDISTWTVMGLESKVYTGKLIEQNIYVVSSNGERAKFKASYRNNKEVGTATVIIVGIGEYTGIITKTFSITKAENPVTVKAAAKNVKLKKLKKKTQTVKAITVNNAQGKVTYKLVKKGISKKIRKLVKINSKGVITVKRWKKAKKGNYKIVVKITAKGNSNFNAKTFTKTVKIKIK